MKFTGEAAALPPHPTLSQQGQEAIIFRVAATIGVPATFLAAIRIAEAGGPGREFGVLSDTCPTYEDQAREAAVSILHNIYRFTLATGQWPGTDSLSNEFVAWMAYKGGPEGTGYAPRGAANDPRDLNRFWATNVFLAYTSSGVQA